MEKQRIDQWLWVVRIFKSRSVATAACKSGKIIIDDEKVKPSHLIVSGTIISVRKDYFEIKYRVENLIKNRLSPKLVAEYCIRLTSDEEIEQEKQRLGRHTGFREKGLGRPTKKERRSMATYLKKED